MCTKFNRLCKACEQKNRNEEKNTDRPTAIIEQRAARTARQLGVSREYVLAQMGWRSGLTPLLRLYMEPDARCRCCGHAFLNERDIQIEHILPPRSDTDRAREHARNLQFLCGSCNRTKGHKDFGLWLDEQEDARISNEGSRDTPPDEGAPPAADPQLTLF